MAKILIVEDDLNLVELIRDRLTAAKHTVEHVDNGEDALKLLDSFPYDLVLMDVGLPGLSGLDVCQAYRDNHGLARILMLTGKGTINDKISGFTSGADDYLTKPFDARELTARVSALLKRPSEIVPSDLSLANLVLDRKMFQVIKDNEPVKLSPKEFVLLEFLMRHPNTAFNSEVLLDRIWPSDSETTTD